MAQLFFAYLTGICEAESNFSLITIKAAIDDSILLSPDNDASNAAGIIRR